MGILGTIGLVVSAVLAMSLINAIRVDRIFKKGRRFGEECGNEYLEIETDKYAIYDAFSSRREGLSKPFLVTLTMLRVAMLVSLFTLLAVVYTWPMKDVKLKDAWLLLVLVLSVFIVCIVLWVVAWTKHFRKNETNIFYQNKPKDAKNAYGAYRKQLLITGLTILGLCALVTVVVGIWAFRAQSRSPSSVGATTNGETGATDPYKKAEWLQTTASHLMIGTVTWTLLFVMYVVISKHYFNLVASANSDYYGALISNVGAASKPALLKDALDKFVKVCMPVTNSVANSGTGMAELQIKLKSKGAGVDEVVELKVEQMLLLYFANNIRNYNDANGIGYGGDDITVVKPVLDNGELWKYVMHRQGKEFDDVKEYLEENVGRLSEEQVKAYVTPALEHINNIRNALRNIRDDKVVADNVKKFVRGLFIFGVVISAIILYLIFHYQYQQNPGRTVMQWCAMIIVLTVFATYYGWVNSAMRL